MHLNSYLLFNGQCKEAFEFYEKALGGKIQAMFVYAGTPAEAHVPPELSDKIMHGSMQIGDSILMGSDAPGPRQDPQGFHVNIALNDAKEGERLFNALSENGTVKMAFGKTFWSKGFGMLVDRFGVPWMINCE